MHQLISGGDIVTMNEHREVLVGGSVVIDDDIDRGGRVDRRPA